MMGPGARLALLAIVLVAAACTTTEETLDPAQINPPPASTTPDAAPAPTGTAEAGAVRVRIDPIVGAPAAAAGPVSSQLTARAPERGFAVVGTGDASATHILKGYFSASPEAGDTTVFYVWDVIDAAGNRVHRFSGQQKVRGNQGWRSVDEAALQAIADQTATAFGSWLAGRSG